jgi:hypothetical protein
VPRGKFIAMNAYIKKNRDLSNKQPNDVILSPRKTRTNQTQNRQMKRNNKDQG